VATVVVNSMPIGVAITPEGSHLYVTNFHTHNVSVIATATTRVLATVADGAAPFGVAIIPDGRRAYVVNFVDKFGIRIGDESGELNV